MSLRRFRHWTSSVPALVKLERVLRYPSKLKKVVGDPRSRVGTLYDALAELSRRHGGGHANLTPCEYRVFSQNGEDGIIAEVVRRVGAEFPRTFAEFGAGAAVSGNTVFLADVLGWSGLFIEPAEDDFALLERKYRTNPRVVTVRSFVRPDNIDDLLSAVPDSGGLGVLSVDVDGNDYYIWKAIVAHRPVLVVIEYNGALPLREEVVQPFAEAPWTGTDYFGASLGALVALGREKGYFLLHTDLSGTNAFFVDRRYLDRFADLQEVPERVANYELIGLAHLKDRSGRRYVRIESTVEAHHHEA